MGQSAPLPSLREMGNELTTAHVEPPPRRCHGRPLCPQHNHGRTRPRQRTQNCRQRIHGLPHDGIRSRKGGALALSLVVGDFSRLTVLDVPQWVKPVAEAGGKSYTFHIEALSNPGAHLRLGATLFKTRTVLKISLLWPRARRLGLGPGRPHPRQPHALRRRHLPLHPLERHLGLARPQSRHAPRHDRRPGQGRAEIHARVCRQGRRTEETLPRQGYSGRRRRRTRNGRLLRSCRCAPVLLLLFCREYFPQKKNAES